LVKLTQMMKAKEWKGNSPNPAYGYILSEDRQYYVKIRMLILHFILS
jgi:hypothetical protein